MKKFRLKLYIVHLIIFAITFLIFYFGYVFLSENYIDNRAGENLVHMADSAAVEFNLKTNRKYNEFLEFFNTYEETSLDATVSSFTNNKDKLDIINPQFGYITKTVNSGKTIYTYHIEDKEYVVRNENYTVFNQDKIAIYKLSNILNGYTDTTNFLVFRHNDCIMFFDAFTYLNEIFLDIDGMEEDSGYFIMQEDGIIVIEYGNEQTNHKFYVDVLEKENLKYSYDMVSLDLLQGISGHAIFTIDKGKVFFIYSPLLTDLLNEPMFIGYKIPYTIGVKGMNYLKLISLVSFSAIFIIYNLTYLVSGILYRRKESDLVLSKLSQYYLKPYLIKLNKKGKVILMNKTFRSNIDDLNRYQSINDLVLMDETLDIHEVFKKQIGFTAILTNINKMMIYIHFLIVKNGNKVYLLGENVTEEVDENTKNRQIALYNPVTQLPNKNLLDKELKQLIATGDISNNYNSLIAVDITDFNKINRIFGFASADKMLRSITKLLNSSIEGMNGTVFNIRTSLFMILLKNVSSFNEVILWSKRIITLFQEPIGIKDDYLTTIEFKMGIFNIDPKKVEDFDAFKIYDCAAIALDRAKNSRLTKCAIYSSEFGAMLSREQIMEEDLRKAIVNKEFVMFYQAQYNTKTKKIDGFEALVRWNNPKYKLESVEHFISLAEKNGMIIEIGQLIMDETFRFAKSIENTGIHVSINVSPVQLLQSGFVTDLITCFEKYELKKESIAVEITETFLMENSDSIISKLKLLRERGFSIHLDDFGIGYSSMLYLKDLPVNVIKIDKEFIKHILNDKFSRIIVSKVIQIAVNLSLNIICEGVETEKQSELLSKMGCNLIQGYLISKPIPEEDALKLIEKYNPINENKGKKSKVKEIDLENDDEF